MPPIWQNPLELVLRVDGQAVSWFRPNVRRPDISKYLGLPAEGLGLAGFDMPAPAALADGQRHAVEVVSAADGQLLKNGRQQCTAAARRAVPMDAAAPRVLPPVRRHWPQPVVSVVLLNRNGHDVLQAFLHSWVRYNITVPAELIVVDHASTDDSLALLRQWRGRLDLKVLALDHNGSFSASSNLGANHARGQFLLFMNNDIVWLQDALPRLLESLHDTRVGVVGIKLLKVVGESRAGAQFASEVQHLGVRFKLNHLGYWPYEVEPSAQHDEAEHAPQFVPAVTGAVLLCRKADFDAVGGFHPEYFYGFEDVELCLRLAYRLRKAVVCRNDCVALHHHGHTRLSGREMSIYDRVLKNSAVLESHIGVWIKQAYWRSLVTATATSRVNLWSSASWWTPGPGPLGRKHHWCVTHWQWPSRSVRRCRMRRCCCCPPITTGKMPTACMCWWWQTRATTSARCTMPAPMCSPLPGNVTVLRWGRNWPGGMNLAESWRRLARALPLRRLCSCWVRGAGVCACWYRRCPKVWPMRDACRRTCVTRACRAGCVWPVPGQKSPPGPRPWWMCASQSARPLRSPKRVCCNWPGLVARPPCRARPGWLNRWRSVLEVLFVHPNFPGQFRKVAAALARLPGVQVVGVGDESWMKSTVPLQGVPVIGYPAPAEGDKDQLHPWSRKFDAAIRRGEQVMQTLAAHKEQGLEPDVIVTHPGWGDAYFLRDFFPGTKVVGLV
jgi:GT2 family glycosyltransferase